MIRRAAPPRIGLADQPAGFAVGHDLFRATGGGGQRGQTEGEALQGKRFRTLRGLKGPRAGSFPGAAPPTPRARAHRGRSAGREGRRRRPAAGLGWRIRGSMSSRPATESVHPGTAAKASSSSRRRLRGIRFPTNAARRAVRRRGCGLHRRRGGEAVRRPRSGPARAGRRRPGGLRPGEPPGRFHAGPARGKDPVHTPEGRRVPRPAAARARLLRVRVRSFAGGGQSATMRGPAVLPVGVSPPELRVQQFVLQDDASARALGRGRL